jgi:hypothetical protein
MPVLEVIEPRRSRRSGTRSRLASWAKAGVNRGPVAPAEVLGGLPTVPAQGPAFDVVELSQAVLGGEVSGKGSSQSEAGPPPV